MRPRRLRGLGCLGCFPFGGLLFMMLPLIAIAALIYFLVNRQQTTPVQPAQPGQPPQPYLPPGGGFCSGCGKPLTPGSKFCAGCGAPTASA